jgi:predicted nucleic acid-binding protein
MESVYIETSVISYLTGRRSPRLITAAHQQITRDWWDFHRQRFELFISPLVLDEASGGDPDAAAKRLRVIKDFPILEITGEAMELADTLIKEGALPAQAKDDAAHIAISTIHNIEYLLTWNCRHLDNAETKPVIRSICAIKGYICPEICTPVELMGE